MLLDPFADAIFFLLGIVKVHQPGLVAEVLLSAFRFFDQSLEYAQISLQLGIVRYREQV